jgi:hypothetical protein
MVGKNDVIGRLKVDLNDELEPLEECALGFPHHDMSTGDGRAEILRCRISMRKLNAEQAHAGVVDLLVRIADASGAIGRFRHCH